MDANTPYEILQFLSNKNQNGYLTPDNYMLIINQAQRSFLSYLLGEFQQYQYGRAVAKVELGMSERILQTLAPFISVSSTISVDSNGLATYPDDYEQIVAINWGASLKRVRYSQQDSLYSYLNSKIDPIATNPVYLISKEGFTVYPNNIGNISISYVSTPPDIIWGSTTNVFGQLVYDPTTSVAPLWYDADFYSVLVRAAQMLGINLQERDMEQYATMVKTTGE